MSLKVRFVDHVGLSRVTCVDTFWFGFFYRRKVSVLFQLTLSPHLTAAPLNQWPTSGP